VRACLPRKTKVAVDIATSLAAADDDDDAPNGIRTRATALKGPRPGPLVDGGWSDPGYRQAKRADDLYVTIPQGTATTSYVIVVKPAAADVPEDSETTVR
jgi:hypothetical protein